MNLKDVLVVLFTLLCGFFIFQILWDLFGRKPSRQHYAVEEDTSLRINRRRMQRQLFFGKIILLVMCLLVVIGAVFYFRGG